MVSCGGRRGRSGRRRRLLRLRLLDDLDAAPVELAVERVLLERVELVRLDDLGELRRLQRPGLLRSVQQLLELVVAQQMFDVDGRHEGSSLRAFYPPPSRPQTRVSSPSWTR